MQTKSLHHESPIKRVHISCMFEMTRLCSVLQTTPNAMFGTLRKGDRLWNNRDLSGGHGSSAWRYRHAASMSVGPIGLGGYDAPKSDPNQLGACVNLRGKTSFALHHR